LIAAPGQVKTVSVTLSSPTPAARPLQPGDFAAVLDWWRDAGVDQQFADEARDWLAAPAPAVTDAPIAAAPVEAKVAPAPPVPKIGGAPEAWPTELAVFTGWWLNEPSLDNGQVFARVPPRGPRGAPLLVLLDHPEAGDSDVLLSGAQGKLVRALLAALGVSPDQAYVASLLPRHMPLPDWPALAAAGLGDLALHHIALAAPQRVISFGKHVSSLVGHDPAKTAAAGGPFYHLGSGIPALNTLMARPRGKADLWRALLDWQPT
jgi:DNA polymerase